LKIALSLSILIYNMFFRKRDDANSIYKDVRKYTRKIKRERKRAIKRINTFEANASEVKTKRVLRKGLLILLLYYLIIPPFLFPVRGAVTSGYSIRIAPESVFLPNLELHPAMDIAVQQGTMVRAAKSGRVASAGYHKTAGNYVLLRHWLGFSTFYGHLESDNIADNQFVFKGFPIGKAGSTGRSTGPHVHFEVRWFGMPLPPNIFCIFDSIRSWIVSLILHKI